MRNLVLHTKANITFSIFYLLLLTATCPIQLVLHTKARATLESFLPRFPTVLFELHVLYPDR